MTKFNRYLTEDKAPHTVDIDWSQPGVGGGLRIRKGNVVEEAKKYLKELNCPGSFYYTTNAASRRASEPFIVTFRFTDEVAAMMFKMNFC